ncbi:MAG TPA: CheB methylesterase domain-containing protein, partial [Candidatus Wallbacteria bacterium]|nr:CheB methylesterase domain-containing protein [Candidatus Wallbacteria bacterium]
KKVLGEELIPKIKSLYAISLQDKNDKQIITKPEEGSKKKRADIDNQRIDALIIGSSTGGPNALAKLIADIPSDIGVPVLIVQHMPPLFTRFLAERLASKSKLVVYESVSGMIVEKNRIYIAPGDFHMTVKKEGNAVKIYNNKEEHENSCRPSVDVLFRSAAAVYGCNILAVILTGMGHDGLKGCHAVKNAGGRIFVQDSETSVVSSMPCSVSNAGLSDGVFPIDSIGCEIVKKIREANSLSDMLRRV